MNGERLFRTLLDSLYEGVYYVTPERRIQYWNKGAESIAGFTLEDVQGKCCHDGLLMHTDDHGRQLCHMDCPMAYTLRDGQERRARVYLHHKEGHRVPVNVCITAVRDEDVTIVGGLEAFHDDTPTMAALKELDDLRQSSRMCALTGVANRCYGEEVLGQRLEEVRRNVTSLAVFFIDVDHFKRVNDDHGHVTGDVVLRMVARSLSGAMRPYDLLARWGGEEFLALMPGVQSHELFDIGDRLRSLVESSSRVYSESKLCVTISVGGCLAMPSDSITSLLDRADQLMYESKNQGRNRVTVKV